MSLQNFIPQVWAGELLIALRKQHVFPTLCNKDYEGEIKSMGDTVKINGIGDITISSYSKDTDITPPQALTDAQTTLTVSQAKYFNFAIDDVDAAQQYPKVMQEAMSRAAYNLADVIDQYVAGFYTDVQSSSVEGSVGSPLTPAVATDANTGTTAWDYLIKLATRLNENNVPKSDRWCVVPPWYAEMIYADRRFTGYATDAAKAAQISGGIDGTPDPDNQIIDTPDPIAVVRGMKIYESNNIPVVAGTPGATGSVYTVLAGHPMAITYADNVVKTEAYRPPYRFADAVKGLHLYGVKVTRPYALSLMYAGHP